ncbi:MAG: PKD domain-containing protein [Thermoplasmata archaeon]|nr:PKD domain-containing protein [Thermoplasmata archaeon]
MVHEVGGVYDPGHATVFLADSSGCIYCPILPPWAFGRILEVRGGTVVRSTQMPSYVSSLTLDPKSGYLYGTEELNPDASAGETVLVLNGTTIVQNLTNASAFDGPSGAVYDPANGYVYVSNYGSRITILSGTRIVSVLSLPGEYAGVAYDSSNGLVYAVDFSNSSLTVINGTQVVGSIGGVASCCGGNDFQSPLRLSYDPLHNDLVVTNWNGSFVTVVAGNETNGSGVLAKIKVPANETTVQTVFDPANGLDYVMTSGVTELIALNGSKEVTSSLINPCPCTSSSDFYSGGAGLVYDPMAGAVFVGDPVWGPNITILSTLLGIRAPTLASGPLQEVGRNFSVNASLWAVGNGRDNASATVEPAVGLTCSLESTVKIQNLTGPLSATCLASMPGEYTLWLNVTDGAPRTVWARSKITVTPALSLTPASASRTSLDVGQLVTLSVSAFAGPGGYSYVWTGLPAGCAGTVGSISCYPSAIGRFLVWVTVTDAAGASLTSSNLSFDVFADPKVVLQAPTSVDLGQGLLVEARATLGSGGFDFVWSGLPPGCPPPADSPVVVCSAINGTGRFGPTVTATDSNGWPSTFGPVTLTSYADPVITQPWLSRSVIDAGQSVTANVSISGGTGEYLEQWLGLPPGSSPSGTSALLVPSVAGVYTISLALSDSNGFEQVSPAVSLVVNPPPTVTVVANASDTLAGEPVSFAVVGAGGTGPLQFLWRFGDGATGEGPTVTHTFPRAGAYATRVWANDSVGGSANASWTLTARTSPIPPPVHPTPSLLGVPEGLALVLVGLGVAVACLAIAVVMLLIGGQNRGARRPPGSV